MNEHNKETAIHDEHMNLKSIASSLEKVASKGIDTFNPCLTTNN